MAILFKPKKKNIPAVRIVAGREICTDTRQGHLEYRIRTEKMARRQNMVCGICKDPSNPMSLASGFPFSATFEHEDLRGMGGARRNDAIEKDGKPYNSAAHYICNMRKSSKRYA